jgi:hypothetical protein
MAKCVKCLHGARISVTGVNPPSNTLKIDMGGAVLYVIPDEDGIQVSINSESLVDGDYAFAIWDRERWIYATKKGE